MEWEICVMREVYYSFAMNMFNILKKIEFSKKMKFTKLRALTELRKYYEEFLRARTYPYVIGIPIQYIHS